MHFGISEKSYRLICDAFAQFPELEKVFIFGSRAKGNYRPGSDIDLAIEGKLCTKKTAYKLSVLLNEKLPIPYHVDVVCLNELDQNSLKEHIQRVGVPFLKK